MVQEVEGTHLVGDVTLFTKSWKPSDPPVAKLIFIHGFNDHMDRYYELFPTLASRGIQVDGFDQRGWGRSVRKESDKGLTGPTETVITDIVSFISAKLPSSIPIFVMGHSMGGGEALVLASNPQHADLVGQIRGWILESPLIAFPKGHEPSAITIFFGRLARPILPRKQLKSALPAENLTRDPEVVRSLKTDALLHGFGTLEGLSGLIDRTNDLSSGKLKLNKTVKGIWLGHGTVDKATCYEGSKNWFNSQCQDINDKEFKAYDGWYHQLHADLPEDRPVFAKDVGDWIMKRVGREVKL